MKFFPRRKAITLAAVALLASLHAGPAASESVVASGESQTQITEAQFTGVRPEVRLRKLHLVRPDLIPYPIAFDVVC